jgi:hypothetical protein
MARCGGVRLGEAGLKSWLLCMGVGMVPVPVDKMVANTMSKLTRMFGDELYRVLAAAGEENIPSPSITWVVDAESLHKIPSWMIRKWIESFGYSVTSDYYDEDGVWKYSFNIVWM